VPSLFRHSLRSKRGKPHAQTTPIHPFVHIFYLCLQKYQIRSHFNLYVPSLFRHSLRNKRGKPHAQTMPIHPSICPSTSISNSNCWLDIHKILLSSLQKSEELEQISCNLVRETHTLLMGINGSVPYYINFFRDLV
jgi:hypothetical protein